MHHALALDGAEHRVANLEAAEVGAYATAWARRVGLHQEVNILLRQTDGSQANMTSQAAGRSSLVSPIWIEDLDARRQRRVLIEPPPRRRQVEPQQPAVVALLPLLAKCVREWRIACTA